MNELKNNNERDIKTPLSFHCEYCDTNFISNEYFANGLYIGSMLYKKAIEHCPKCKKEIEGGRIYRPLINSKEWCKWYEQ